MPVRTVDIGKDHQCPRMRVIHAHSGIKEGQITKYINRYIVMEADMQKN